MTVPSVPVRQAQVTAGLVSRLKTTGLLVGDGRAPTGGGWQGAAGQSVFVSYLVVHPISARRQGPDSSISDRNDAPTSIVQVTAVGQDRRAAETAADLAAARLLNRAPLDIPGQATVLLVHETSAGSAPDESVTPPVWTAIERYRLDLQPT